MARLTRYEQETIINFNEEEATANVYTYNKALQRKLAQLAQERPQECVLDVTQDYSGALVCTIPKRWVTIKPPRILSEAQKATLVKAQLAAKSIAHATAQELLTIPEGNYTPDVGEGENTP